MSAPLTVSYPSNFDLNCIKVTKLHVVRKAGPAGLKRMVLLGFCKVAEPYKYDKSNVS